MDFRVNGVNWDWGHHQMDEFLVREVDCIGILGRYGSGLGTTGWDYKE